MCRANGLTPDIREEVRQMTSTAILVAAHLGVSVVPVSMARIGLENVVCRPIEGPAPVARLALALPRRVRSPISRNFLALLP